MIGLIGAVLPSVMEVAGRFLPEDKEKRAAAEREIEAQLTTHLAKIDLAQLDINKTEAAHRSIFRVRLAAIHRLVMRSSDVP